MTAADFRATLDRLHLSQSGFAREIETLAGVHMPLRTVQSWALGESPISAPVVALLAMLEWQAETNRSQTTPGPR